MNERKIAENFLLEYNEARGRSFTILRAGNPPEPDLVCSNTVTEEQIGIEVATAYYDQQHAESAWQRARGRDALPYYIGSDSTENNKALVNLEAIIQRKRKKQYYLASPIILVVAVAPLRLHLDDHEDKLDEIRIPEENPFDSIFVFSQIGQLYQLFPLREWIVR